MSIFVEEAKLTKTVDYAIVNIVAQPHPPGIYKHLFELAADQEGVPFWGDLSAGISPVTERNGLLIGRLAFWTDIDPKAPVIKKSSKEQVSQRDASVGVLRGIGFNPRVFNFAFNLDKHTLFVELSNDEGKKTSAGMVERSLKAIFFSLSTSSEIDVQLKAGADALKFIFGLSQINRVEIDFRLPNPDDLSEEEREILKEMDHLNARRINVEIYRDRDEPSIQLTDRYQALAKLAKDNGYVVAEGNTHDGERDVRSTKNRPAVVSRVFEGAGDDSSYGALVALASE